MRIVRLIISQEIGLNKATTPRLAINFGVVI